MNDEQQLAPVEEQKKLIAIIGGVLVPLFIIIVGNFICNKHQTNIKKHGTYVIAKKIKWESAEVSDGISIFEFYINGNKIIEKASGCGEQKSVGRYFIIQYYSKALWYKINYLCTDSISDSKMKDIDINKTWKEKPIELLSNE